MLGCRIGSAQSRISKESGRPAKSQGALALSNPTTRSIRYWLTALDVG